jgi:peptidoglycan hydrolase-like protein with peptidoglycan-binding domain
MPSHGPDARSTRHRWRKFLAPLVIGPAIAVGGVAASAGSASAQCSVSDGLLSQTASSIRSDSVRCLQQSLRERGVDAGPVDGWFGPVTKSAVTHFQQANGLTVDGWMGRETRTALGITRSGSARSTHSTRSTRTHTQRRTHTHRTRTQRYNGPSGSSGVDWDAVARCESGGDWSAHLRTNHVGTFSGGLMIMQSAWRQYGGTQFAPSAGQASRAEQIIVAERVAARVGADRAWECPTPHR